MEANLGVYKTVQTRPFAAETLRVKTSLNDCLQKNTVALIPLRRAVSPLPWSAARRCLLLSSATLLDVCKCVHRTPIRAFPES